MDKQLIVKRHMDFMVFVSTRWNNAETFERNTLIEQVGESVRETFFDLDLDEEIDMNSMEMEIEEEVVVHEEEAPKPRRRNRSKKETSDE